MKRSLIGAVVSVALVVPALRADVKTTEKNQIKFEGMIGRFMRGAADPVTSTVAVKGDRKLSMNETTGEIIDLAEQQVYRLNLKKKEYTTLTFDQVRKEWQKDRDEAESNARKLQEAQQDNPQAGVALEFSADVKETGQTRTIAGYEAREVILTITGVHPGKTLEEGGGSVMTNTMWLGPKIPALDEIHEFDLKYFKAIIGDDAGAEVMQQLTTVFAMFISAKPMMEKMQAEGGKLKGTPLVSMTAMETVKSAEEMKAGAGDSGSGGGSGIGGMLARRMGARAASGGGARSTVFTSTHEFMTVTTSAAAEDVAIPAGFKEKK